jgi:hypothetical protein
MTDHHISKCFSLAWIMSSGVAVRGAEGEGDNKESKEEVKEDDTKGWKQELPWKCHEPSHN